MMQNIMALICIPLVQGFHQFSSRTIPSLERNAQTSAPAAPMPPASVGGHYPGVYSSDHDDEKKDDQPHILEGLDLFLE